MAKTKYYVDRKDVLDYVKRRLNEGANKSKAFDEYCTKHNLPIYIVRQNYYKALDKYDIDSNVIDIPFKEVINTITSGGNLPDKIVSENPTIQSTQPEDNTLETISQLVELGESTNIDLTPILTALLPLFKAATKSEDSSIFDQEMERLSNENKELYDMLQEEEKKTSDIKTELEEMRQHVEALDGYLDEFLKLPSLKKLGKLEDFTYNLKILVDKTGLVQRVEEVSGT
jgi:hypothetical protein